jgi:hypothetical protein
MADVFATFELRKVIRGHASMAGGISQRAVILKYRQKIVVSVIERPCHAR